jgi:hypothetical protein
MNKEHPQGDMFNDRLNTALDRMKGEHVGGGRTLTQKDLEDLKGAVRKVYNLMKDGRWYTPDEIIAASGVRSGERRMRQLRDVKGMDIQARRVGGTRKWVYRLVIVETEGPGSSRI